MTRTFGQVLAKETQPTDSILDIGCGDKKIHRSLRFKNITTVDAFEKVKPDYLIDLENNNLPFEENSFDVVLLLDFIEHLDKERGFEIIEQAKKIARRSVIVFTPSKFNKNEAHTNNPEKWCYGNTFNLHKSLWVAEEFFEDGWVAYDNVLEYLQRDYFFGVWYK